jgi:hypothetical protein
MQNLALPNKIYLFPKPFTLTFAPNNIYLFPKPFTSTDADRNGQIPRLHYLFFNKIKYRFPKPFTSVPLSTVTNPSLTPSLFEIKENCIKNSMARNSIF